MKAGQQLQDRPGFGRVTGGFLAGTMVFTAEGAMPVEYLAPGDRVVTRSGLLPLVSVSSRRLASAALIRIRAATQAPTVPSRDLFLCPDQLVLLRDWRAQILFGQTVAAVAAARLVDGEYVVREKRRDAWFFSPAFETEAVIFAEGQEVGLTASRTLSLTAPCR
ncbi:MAG: hypothetical protein B7Z10_08420 [Rhodobacterales bacterium 32-66-7]|nr:MAG: hypothetical protein B7Z10_08420 [Rhodobacterales bacterium 32-66-7]